jgi:nicotinate-nucleotide--dimethylbenzimidazole phosphoribosyltransferase
MADAPELARLLAGVPPLDAEAAVAAGDELDRKTKPRGSLGRLEELAVRVAAIRGTPSPRALRAVIVVAAADHGVTAEGVSAYPSAVTRQMVANFVSGGAAICVLARTAGAELVVADAGLREPLPHPLVRDLRTGPGTDNAAAGPAMSRAQAVASLLAGARLARELAERGCTLLALGEMGIGNSTAASAVTAAMLGCEPSRVCGPGTGLDRAGIERKVAVVGRMLDVNRPVAADPIDVLRVVGGFEIGVLAGAALGAAGTRCVVLLDGFITGAAALLAVALAPRLAGFLLASHRSAEPAHGLVLERLGLEPILDLGLRLGEGSGAALAIPVVRSATAILTEMATFADAQVTDTGR